MHGENLQENDYQFQHNSLLKTGLVIDFMSVIRRINFTKACDFKYVFEGAWNIISQGYMLFMTAISRIL